MMAQGWILASMLASGCSLDGESTCVADFTLGMSDGTSTTLNYCAEASMDATFEFDPDKPPEVRDPTLVFHAVTDGEFECSVTITEPAICGVGYYRMDGSAGSTSSPDWATTELQW